MAPSPLLLLLLAEGLSRLLKEAYENGNFKGIFIVQTCNIIDVLFVDDVLIFHDNTRRIVEILKNILDLFHKSIDMKKNIDKSTMSIWDILQHGHIYFS